MPNTNSRVGIAGTVYHQLPGHNPTPTSLRCSMFLKTEEEAFSRTPPNPVGRKWQKLDLGWLPGCSMLCIKNLEKPGGNDLEIGSPSVILSGQSHPIVPLPLVIPPGMVTVLYPTTELAVRCLGGEAQYTLFAVPE
jgi:hypothetical protein